MALTQISKTLSHMYGRLLSELLRVTVFDVKFRVSEFDSQPVSHRHNAFHTPIPMTRAAWAATGWCWRLLHCWPWPTVRAAKKPQRGTGRLRRPPAELDAAHRQTLPPRRHSLLQQGVALLRGLLLRGYLWACGWLRPTPGPDFRVHLRRVDPGGT